MERVEGQSGIFAHSLRQIENLSNDSFPIRDSRFAQWEEGIKLPAPVIIYLTSGRLNLANNSPDWRRQ